MESKFPAFISCEGQRFIKVVLEKKFSNNKKTFNVSKNKNIRFTQLNPYK